MSYSSFFPKFNFARGAVALWLNGAGDGVSSGGLSLSTAWWGDLPSLASADLHLRVQKHSFLVTCIFKESLQQTLGVFAKKRKKYPLFI